MFQVAFSGVLLSALAEPLVGDPLGADQHGAPGVHRRLVARAVPEQLGSMDQLAWISERVGL